MELPPNAVSQAMILAAGLGTRLRPWTDQHPKALAPVNGKPLLQHNILYLQRHGIYDVIVNVHHFAAQIAAAVKKNRGWGSRITLSDETDQVLETGGGLKKAGWFFTTPHFVLLNVDILTDLDLTAMIGAHLQHAPLATLAVRNRDTSRYFLFGNDDALCGWRNTRTGEQVLVRQEAAPVQKAFSGIHVISSTIFPLLGIQGKFSMVEAYLQLGAAHIIRAFDHTPGRFADVGTAEAVIKAEQYFS